METGATSFTSRRPASHTLPQFHLPLPAPPIDFQVPRVSSLDGLSPPPSGVSGGSSHNSQAGVQLQSPQNNWTVAGTSSYTHSSMNHGQPPLMHHSYSRPIYSPPSSTYHRSSQSPATTDGLAAPTYDGGSSSFPLSMPGGGVGHSSILSQHSSQPPLQNQMMSNHSQGSQPPTPSTSTGTPDNYQRPQTTSSYYSGPPTSTPQPSFSSFASTHPSPQQTSPITSGALSRGVSTLSLHQQHTSMQLPSYNNRSYSSYTLPPAMGGPVMSNMANPGGQMTLMNGISPMAHSYHPSGQLVNPHMYSHNQSNPQQDRPYKCDLCPTAFNRNHDLKRHRRIHLAIKPFPCTFCEKSFSRKDALKRHRLVKGCGNGKTPPDEGNEGSPREEVKRESGTSSPVFVPKEEPM